ncbi:MAG: pyrroline-5-carboxylate reductase, partial [Oricola sp.]|nr:pyrroline-5-carboxylate reductase [Oricola sp.]
TLAKDAIAISVMAGKSVASIQNMLNGAPRVARVMPNLPAAIRRGASGLYAPGAIDAKGRAIIETLMQAAGESVWVRSEQEIDYVTAVSGSGPAYYFLLTEALAEAGASLGLDRQAAAALARATLAGAGAMMDADPRAPAEMRKAVTSPGGTTEAALKIFDGDDAAMRKLVEKAVQAAAKRAGELTD